MVTKEDCRPRPTKLRGGPEEGFTLVELLMTMALAAVILTLSAGALRQFWFNRSLDAAIDEVVTQLRQEQEDAVSESAPLVFGARFTVGSPAWTLYRYDPSGNSGTGSCTSSQRELGGGAFGAPVIVSAVAVTNDESAAEHAKCRTSSSDKIIFFYARGTSTGGSVTFTQPAIDRSSTVTVSGLTGRVSRS